MEGSGCWWLSESLITADSSDDADFCDCWLFESEFYGSQQSVAGCFLVDWDG